MGPTALLPLRRKACWGFFRPENSWQLRPGLNPRTWVPKGSTLPLDHRSRCTVYLHPLYSYVTECTLSSFLTVLSQWYWVCGSLLLWLLLVGCLLRLVYVALRFEFCLSNADAVLVSRQLCLGIVRAALESNRYLSPNIYMRFASNPHAFYLGHSIFLGLTNITLFFVIKLTRCTNFTNSFWHETLHVSDSSSVHHQEFIHCKLGTGVCHAGVPSWSCSKAVYKTAWYTSISVPNVRWKTPDDGQRKCPKYLEFLDKINLGN
jgi:hypothetical protein